jgi:hypothetical protein
VGDYPFRQLILHPRILIGWFSWELNPEVLVSFWMKASANWGGGVTSAEGFRDGEAGRAPFSHYALAFALQLRKSTENLSQGSRAAWGLLVAPTWLCFERLPRLACWTSDHPSFAGDFSQPLVGTGAFRVAAEFISDSEVLYITKERTHKFITIEVWSCFMLCCHYNTRILHYLV